MSTYEFLLQLGFWQWVGVIILVAIVTNGIAEVVASILKKL